MRLTNTSRPTSLARILTTAFLSLSLVPGAWFVTKLSTAGLVVAQIWKDEQPPFSISEPILHVIVISAILDFFLWFLGLWGAWTLWRRFPSANGVLGAKLMCALSIAFYPLMEAARLFHHGTLWGPIPVLAALFAVSLLLCFGTIYGLYAVALKLYHNGTEGTVS